jgi:hypothetical protein
MASRRTKSISAKVTESEYARLVAEAGELTISEWLRTVALEAPALRRRESEASTLLAELLALRTIVINLQTALIRGEPVTLEAVQRLAARADREKVAKAHERLTAMTTRSEP